MLHILRSKYIVIEKSTINKSHIRGDNLYSSQHFLLNFVVPEPRHSLQRDDSHVFLLYFPA